MNSSINEIRAVRDIEIIAELMNISVNQLLKELSIVPMTFNKWKRGNGISKSSLEKIYSFAYRKGIDLNGIKSQLYLEDYAGQTEKVLFHGSKNGISGPLSLDYSGKNNDFGSGFYCGQTLSQASMFVSGYKDSFVYVFKFDTEGLEGRHFNVDQEWILSVAYYRGRLGEYSSSQAVQRIVREIESSDYVTAPIADNRIFELIDSFVYGEITDVQLSHCLAASGLGRQYVIRSRKALEKVSVLEKCYISSDEKDYYRSTSIKTGRLSQDKVRIARKQYRGIGRYIEEVLI